MYRLPVPHEFDPDALSSAEADIRQRLADTPVDIEVQRAISNLYRAASVVSRRAEREMLTELGLSWSAFTSMWVLWVWGEMDATQLASEVALTPGTVTGVRKGLERQGYVESRRDPNDGRRVMVRLTDDGHETFGEFYPRFHAWSQNLFADLSPDATTQLGDLLQLVILRPPADEAP
jgi:DNA-binding MarR family transcriptional regulator